jgi:hypothetical protein
MTVHLIHCSDHHSHDRFADRQVHGAGFVFCQRPTSKYVYFVILFYGTVTSVLLVLPVILELSQLLAISAAIQYIHMFH